jgi:hypothetical protein
VVYFIWVNMGTKILSRTVGRVSKRTTRMESGTGLCLLRFPSTHLGSGNPTFRIIISTVCHGKMNLPPSSHPFSLPPSMSPTPGGHVHTGVSFYTKCTHFLCAFVFSTGCVLLARAVHPVRALSWAPMHTDVTLGTRQQTMSDPLLYYNPHVSMRVDLPCELIWESPSELCS